MSKPKVPPGTGTAGAKLWRAVLDEYDLEERELLLLREAVRTVDTLDALEARVEADGPLLGSSQGERAHPALVEASAADRAGPVSGGSASSGG